MNDRKSLERWIRDVPDFPKKGILFKDITPLLAQGPALREAVQRIAEPFRNRADVVLGIESRGFILGAAVAYELGVGFALARKPGRLPAVTREARYELEYGTDSLQIHQDAFPAHNRVLIVDDLLATGGTAAAALDLATQLEGNVIGCSFLIELSFLGGRHRLGSTEVQSVIVYE